MKNCVYNFFAEMRTNQPLESNIIISLHQRNHPLFRTPTARKHHQSRPQMWFSPSETVERTGWSVAEVRCFLGTRAVAKLLPQVVFTKKIHSDGGGCCCGGWSCLFKPPTNRNNKKTLHDAQKRWLYGPPRRRTPYGWQPSQLQLAVHSHAFDTTTTYTMRINGQNPKGCKGICMSHECE